ncbi:hypothetical protein [Nannocystis bainbridge]|uniref:Uncharacterized protein n=1 Tax=Nannocystis bainbridge TaxID=2995303 RepID=A0ABT5E783_9BACT|nr:hypothetical protein [Nannocystis bainbridge]MDC0720677.1 hypothetical protein [Nannocystis bainbridge]
MRALNASVATAVARSVEWVGGFLPNLTLGFSTARILPPRNSTIVACNMAIDFNPTGSIRLSFRVGLTIFGQVVFTASDTAGTVKPVDLAPGTTIAGLQSIEVIDSGIANTSAGHGHVFFGFA